MKILFIRGAAVLAVGACLAWGQTDPEPLRVQAESSAEGTVELRWTDLGDGYAYRVESADSLGGEWTPLGGAAIWPIADVSFVDPIGSESGARFYRIVAIEAAAPGRLIEAAELISLSTAEIGALFAVNTIPVTPRTGVVAYRVTYETTDALGEPATATGSVVFPDPSLGPAPMMSYQHGTVFEKEDAPSSGDGFEFLIGVGFGSLGYTAVMPDYLGLGGGEGRHPYLHADSEATATIDLLLAAREFALERGVELNGQLFLAGYSQGGHTTMATHRRLQELPEAGLEVTASAPMAGPYDLSGTMADLLLQDTAYASPAYLAYILLSYDDVYGLFDSLSDAFREPYATQLPPLFDGVHSESEINALLPASPSEALTAEFVAAFESDPDHPLRAALRHNDLYDWTPQAPMRMYHCRADRTVPIANSEVALASFKARGAARVELVDPFPFADHGICSAVSLLAAKDWFESMRQ